MDGPVTWARFDGHVTAMTYPTRSRRGMRALESVTLISPRKSHLLQSHGIPLAPFRDPHMIHCSRVVG